MKNIGWIGLGNMGTPMAANLLNKGYTVHYYRRALSKPSPLLTQGGIATDCLEELLKNTDIIFMTLPDDTIVDEISSHLMKYNLTDKIIVNSSTISPTLAEQLDKRISERGGTYLDAPVSGSVKPAIDGTLLFLVGGDQNTYKSLIPYFEVMGKSHYYLGESGQGSKAKLAINYYMAIVVQGLAETVLFAEQNGVSRDLMTQIVNDSACGSGMSKIKTPSIVADEYTAAFPLKFMLKDIRLAQDAGWNTPLSEATLNAYHNASEQGFSEHDLMAVLKAID